MRDKHHITEEPCEAKVSCTVLETSGSREGLAEFNHFYTDSTGTTVANPRHLRKSEKALRRVQRRVSRRKKGSANRKKAINRLGRKHLKVSRQRKDFAIKTALCVVKSNDFVAYVSEAGRRLRRTDLQVRNMVKNHKFAKSISDAAWSQFALRVAVFGEGVRKNSSWCGSWVHFPGLLNLRQHDQEVAIGQNSCVQVWHSVGS